MWTDWRTTSNTVDVDVGKEETLELDSNEYFVAISGYSVDGTGTTYSLQAETSAGRIWGPHGDNFSTGVKSLRSSPHAPSNGLRWISGDQTYPKFILR